MMYFSHAGNLDISAYNENITGVSRETAGLRFSVQCCFVGEYISGE